MAATMTAINKFTTITNPGCVDNHITTSTHTVASITTTNDSENRVGTSVEVPYTPPRVQNYAPEPLSGEEDPAPTGPKILRQVNLSKLSSL